MAPESPSVPRQPAGAVKGVQVAELETVGEQDSGSPTGSVASAVESTGQERKGAETLRASRDLLGASTVKTNLKHVSSEFSLSSRKAWGLNPAPSSSSKVAQARQVQGMCLAVLSLWFRKECSSCSLFPL